MESHGHWRTGRSVGRTIYLNNRLVGCADTPDVAAVLVMAANDRNCFNAEREELEREVTRLSDALRAKHDALMVQLVAAQGEIIKLRTKLDDARTAERKVLALVRELAGHVAADSHEQWK